MSECEMNTRSDFIYEALPCDRYTPFSLAKKIGAIGLLESASFASGKERFSILMTNKAFDTVQDDEGIAFIVDGRRVPFICADKLPAAAFTGKAERVPDILDALSYVAKQNAIDTHGIPLPSSGVGFLSYEFCARADTIVLSKQADPLHLPESEFIACHTYIVFDHLTLMLHIFMLNYNEHQIDLRASLQQLKARLLDMDFTYLEAEQPFDNCTMITDEEQSKASYYDKVNKLKEHIIAGDIVQAVPSRRLQLECKTSALEVYRRLRRLNPSPYLVYLNFGDYQLIASSPESLVRVRSGSASIRPIAGTCARGANAKEDEEHEAKLLSDPKEKAEHLMLVDLARNDLGRVCKAGTVKVDSFMKCQRFSHVIHLVSDVIGAVSDNVSTTDVLRSSFPAGTVSGAPKISAIQILSTLEPIKRRFYAGAIGYIQSTGDLDFCIAIRCALKQENTWTLQAGGGIVYDSNPLREWQETCEKLGALMSVIKK